MSTLVLRDLLVPALTQWGSRTAVVIDGCAWSYTDLEDAARRLVAWFDSIGVGPGTPVALMLPNSIHYVIADLAIALVGAAKVPLNGLLSDSEALFILGDSGAVVCIADERRAELVLEDRSGRTDDLGHVLRVGAAPTTTEYECWDRVLASDPWIGDARKREIPEDAVGLILYTGGTTGHPKGVVHRQKELAANQLVHRIETEIQHDERVLLGSPLPHSSGFLLQTALIAGATTYVEEKFNVDRLLGLIESESISYLFLVPTMFYRLLDRLRTRAADTTSIRTILYGAAPMSSVRLQEGIERFGLVFLQLYAQSEAPNFITRLNKLDHARDRAGSCGIPVAGVEVRILDPVSGAACRSGEAGEIVARTPYTMSEYLNLPDATQNALVDGWLHTGDVGYLDADNYLYIVDRLKDMVISGGLNVYTTEVEAVLLECEGVLHAAVVGIPDPDWGEKVTAFVVIDRSAYHEIAVLEHCRVKLSAYKRPKMLIPTPQLPLTAYGKVDKKTLVEQLASGH